MSGFFQSQTSVEKVAEGCYEKDTSQGWFGAVGLFGGYVNAIVLQALTAEVNDPERLPRALTIHFLKPYPIGRLRVETALERAGASVSVLSFRVFVDGNLCGVGLGTFGKNREAYEYIHAQAPEVPPLDTDSESLNNPNGLECLNNFDIWIQDEKRAQNHSEVVAWARAAKGDAPDNLFYVAISDAIPPVVFMRGGSEEHFGGTMDFTAHFRQPELKLKEGEAILGHLITEGSKSGYVDEDCKLFSASGELLFQSRQMRFVQRIDPEEMRNQMRNKLGISRKDIIQ